MSQDPRRTYRTVIHSRESSQDSRASDSSRSSTEIHYSTSTRMSNAGQKVETGDRVEYLRVPDNERHYITAKTSPSGRVKVHDHRSRIYDPEEPRLSDATDEEFKRSQQRDERRHQDQHRSK